MLANCPNANTDERVPSAGCQSSIHAISVAISSGRPVNTSRRPLFSEKDFQPSMHDLDKRSPAAPYDEVGDP
jgi:hypothetical protein